MVQVSEFVSETEVMVFPLRTGFLQSRFNFVEEFRLEGLTQQIVTERPGLNVHNSHKGKEGNVLQHVYVT